MRACHVGATSTHESFGECSSFAAAARRHVREPAYDTRHDGHRQQGREALRPVPAEEGRQGCGAADPAGRPAARGDRPGERQRAGDEARRRDGRLQRHVSLGGHAGRFHADVQHVPPAFARGGGTAAGEARAEDDRGDHVRFRAITLNPHPHPSLSGFSDSKKSSCATTTFAV